MIIATRLVVYFSNYTVIKVPKDALSRVSKHFFKELKMNYRQLDHLFPTLTTLFYFFDSTENETVKSFFQFNLVNVCEQISEEHFKFISSIIKERNFT